MFSIFQDTEMDVWLVVTNRKQRKLIQIFSSHFLLAKWCSEAIKKLI